MTFFSLDLQACMTEKSCLIKFHTSSQQRLMLELLLSDAAARRRNKSDFGTPLISNMTCNYLLFIF